jgi:RNA polymerase sigma-70 factor (ECF subfamily)
MAVDMSDDWQLLARTADGDDDAFRIIVERHQDRLVRLCQRILQDREEALDAAQEVFIKAYQKAGSLQPKGELFTWLYRVATNHCLNKLRRRRIVRFVPMGGADSDDSSAIEPATASAGPDTELVAREQWQATQSAIDRLPDNQKAVLVLAKFEGLSYRQIAETLEITEGAVESRLFRAMRNLARAQETTQMGVSLGEAQ